MKLNRGLQYFFRVLNLEGSHRTLGWSVIMLALLAGFSLSAHGGVVVAERELAEEELSATPRLFKAAAGDSDELIWWFPPKADAFVIPISAGVLVERTNEALMGWFKEGSPWDLSKLPVVGARYKDRTMVVIIPWPHYAEL